MKITGALLFFLNAFACRTSDTKDDTLDNDGDGYEASEDCNDNDSTMPDLIKIVMVSPAISTAMIKMKRQPVS